MEQAPEFWQRYEAVPLPPPFTAAAPAAMPDGRWLHLPLRDYGVVAVTGFIANQASFSVLRPICTWMAEAARDLGAEVVVGLPTLGHVFGAPVAEALGHSNWVAPAIPARNGTRKRSRCRPPPPPRRMRGGCGWTRACCPACKAAACCWWMT
ncbi:hypothetical protein ACFQU7_17445 [Pseudoroseomonas wenyumeiae]